LRKDHPLLSYYDDERRSRLWLERAAPGLSQRKKSDLTRRIAVEILLPPAYLGEMIGPTREKKQKNRKRGKTFLPGAPTSPRCRKKRETGRIQSSTETKGGLSVPPGGGLVISLTHDHPGRKKIPLISGRRNSEGKGGKSARRAPTERQKR